MVQTVPYHQLLQIVQEANLLPLTSRCNVKCCFCSHRQNPAGIESYAIPALTQEQAKEMLGFLDPAQKIVIGESVSRIMEGEPFLFPHLLEVLSEARRRFPNTLISLTTNGSLLNAQTAKQLAGLLPLEINLSLNTANPRFREGLLKDHHAETAVLSPALLQQYAIPFHGSIVAMPHLTGWSDLAETIRYLDSWGARTIRVFEPGYTRWCPPSVQPSFTYRELQDFLDNLEQIDCPVTLEPGSSADLNPVLAGTMSDTPARAAGLQKYDRILLIDSEVPFSRVDAFLRLKQKSSCDLIVLRGTEKKTLRINKPAQATSGIVVEYDLHPAVPQAIRRILNRTRAKRPIVATSSLAYPVLAEALQAEIQAAQLQLQAVKNNFFGGNIRSAGLLVVDDYLAALSGLAGDLIILPPISFDSKGKDLSRRHYTEIEQGLGIPAVLG